MSSRLSRLKEKFEKTIADHNRSGDGNMHVTWGSTGKADEHFRSQVHTWEGLLTCFNEDFDILLSRSYAPNSADTCTLRKRLTKDVVLPRSEARRLFNVLQSLAAGVSLDTRPRNQPDPEILVTGVEALLSVPEMTHLSLLEALERLSVSAAAVHKQITEVGCEYDYWEESFAEDEEDDYG